MTFFQTGHQNPGRPSFGAWTLYGLGSSNRDLPGFVVMVSKDVARTCDQPLYEHLWSAGFLPAEHQGVKLRAGEHILMDQRSGLLVERIPRPEVEELVLEEVPDVSYEDVGGLDSQIEQIQDAVELPYLYGDLFKDHRLEPPKGILLYGPPGCGKTLIAKAVANSLAKKVAEVEGRPEGRS